MKNRNLSRLTIALCFTLISAGCAPQEKASNADAFLNNLRPLCGKAFKGALVSTDESDAAFGQSELVMHVRDCEREVIRIPFHVNDDRSRTWVISKTKAGLKLEHDHRHEDGSEDAVSLYGGDVVEQSISSKRAAFPANQYSKTLFVQEGLDVSVDNVWTVEIIPNERFVYQLSRPNRLFRVEFDLTKPVSIPPAAWGHDAP